MLLKRLFKIGVLCWLLCFGYSTLQAAETTDSDVVVLSNGHQIIGKISDVSPEQVTIVQAHGSVKLPRMLVQTVHLGMWAKDRGMFDQAYELAVLAWSLPERGPEAALMLAQLLDAQTGKQRDALPYYKAWRDQFGGEDKAVRDRIELLEKHFNDYENALQAYHQEIAKAQSDHLEGLESKGGWLGDNPQHANPINVTVQTIEDGGIKNTVLSVGYGDGGKDKATLRRRVTFDGRKHPIMVFEVLNSSDQTLPISIAVKSGPDYAYHESPVQNVPPNSGWYPVSFAMVEANWKSKASNWANNTTIKNLQNIRELQILFHNKSRSGSIFIDDIPLLR